jgi:hypothetical protein
VRGSVGKGAMLRRVMHWLAHNYTERRCLVAHDEENHVLHVQFGPAADEPAFALDVPLTRRGFSRLKNNARRALAAAITEQQNASLSIPRQA